MESVVVDQHTAVVAKLCGILVVLHTELVVSGVDHGCSLGIRIHSSHIQSVDAERFGHHVPVEVEMVPDGIASLDNALALYSGHIVRVHNEPYIAHCFNLGPFADVGILPFRNLDHLIVVIGEADR